MIFGEARARVRARRAGKSGKNCPLRGVAAPRFGQCAAQGAPLPASRTARCALVFRLGAEDFIEYEGRHRERPLFISANLCV
ncbi:hypothetical protein BVI2075_50047 [Burkholderia vietnamiensis]|nr:hypothetical protein BVI1335_1140024 [Burkholderia vietnamiensis]CAG9210631.1 hypothetical protein BVI2075_50047 [Burkholderia vietnamiensis]